MNLLHIILRMNFSIKINYIFVILFSFAIIVLCCNPSVINPLEFILYTKYIIPIGLLTWVVISVQLHQLIINSFPYEWLSINDIIRCPLIHLYKQLVINFLLFLILQISLGFIIASFITINFSSGFELFKVIIKMYFLYFIIPFIWAWVIGLCIVGIDIKYSRFKSILFAILLFLWIITIIILEFKIPTFNIFIENRLPYIDSIQNLTFHRENLYSKLIYLTSTIVLFFLFMKEKSYHIQYFLSLIIITVVVIGTYNLHNKPLLHEMLLDNDLKLYQSYTKSLKDIETSDNWRITQLKVDAAAEHPIEITLTLDRAEDVTRFSLNEQFLIAFVKNGNKNLKFTQEGNIVEVYTKDIDKIKLFYESTMGTSFYPLTTSTLYLPFEADWYPQIFNADQYVIDSLGTLHTINSSKECDYINIVKDTNEYNWIGDSLDCLSIINGPYNEIEFPKTKFLIYQPFLTKNENYKDFIKYLNQIKKELCTLKNFDSNYCNSTVDSITILPKSLSTASFSQFDSTVSNGNYTFYLDVFTDVNYKPATTHLMELTTFQIPYRLINDENISIYISQYLHEMLNIDSIGYLDINLQKSTITLKEWSSYTNLSIKKKKEFLIKTLEERKNNPNVAVKKYNNKK